MCPVTVGQRQNRVVSSISTENTIIVNTLSAQRSKRKRMASFQWTGYSDFNVNSILPGECIFGT